MGQDSEGHRGSGIPRRTLIKRGAIVGGLVWATPVVQSLRIPAHAQEGQVSELCAACLSATTDPDGTGPQPPVTEHITFNPDATCCDCIAAGGGTLSAVVLCAGGGDCTILTSGPGPCP
jgi:hypothetical protein